MKVLLVLIPIFISCHSIDRGVSLCPDSKIEKFERIGIADTTAVIVSGFISDACNSKKISATVTFKSTGSSFEFVSDSTGEYISSGLSEGSYLVSVKKENYKALPDTLLRFRSGEVIRLDISAAPG
jgi:hypothetical protein